MWGIAWNSCWQSFGRNGAKFEMQTVIRSFEKNGISRTIFFSVTAAPMIKVCEMGFRGCSGVVRGSIGGRTTVRRTAGRRPADGRRGRSSAAPVSSTAPKKKAFDRGGPVWPPRSNAKNGRSGGVSPAKIKQKRKSGGRLTHGVDFRILDECLNIQRANGQAVQWSNVRTFDQGW